MWHLYLQNKVWCRCYPSLTARPIIICVNIVQCTVGRSEELISKDSPVFLILQIFELDYLLKLDFIVHKEHILKAILRNTIGFTEVAAACVVFEQVLIFSTSNNNRVVTCHRIQAIKRRNSEIV